ncbi:sulfotransferase 1C4-like [Globicephala melas]|uniref:sulfotransferase 1C4-like n=1 Tax=Globicephala melas TaxID=9731 RepID=UPI00293D55FB|nr:sulfotransferase 1C4-like [Globicephala melas]
MNIKQKQCKIIYITRNPKDTAVSLFHYYRENPNLPGIETWHELFELFLRGDGDGRRIGNPLEWTPGVVLDCEDTGD